MNLNNTICHEIDELKLKHLNIKFNNIKFSITISYNFGLGKCFI